MRTKMTKYIGAITGEMQQFFRHSLDGSHLSRSVSFGEKVEEKK